MRHKLTRWQKWMIKIDPVSKRLHEEWDEMLDQHALERAQLDQWRAEMRERIGLGKGKRR